MTTFGPAWTGALLLGSASINVPPAWVLAVLALESEFNPYARNASEAFGLWQKMPTNKVPYAVTDPVRQLNDYFAFTRSMLTAFHVSSLTSRAALYCVNLAPARLKDDRYDAETVLYEAPGAAYRQNAAAFGLRANDPVGVLRMKHLETGLDAGIARCQARFDEELAAATSPTVWLGDESQPDLRLDEVKGRGGDG